MLSAGKVTAGLAESSGSLPPALWLIYMQTEDRLPRDQDVLRAKHLLIKYVTTFTFTNSAASLLSVKLLRWLVVTRTL